MKLNVFTITIFLIILVSLVSGIILYPKLNDKVASHWDNNGNVNGYTSKLTSILLLPGIMIILYFLFMILPKIDPLKRNISFFKNEWKYFIITIFLFLLYIHLLTLFYNTGLNVNISKWIIPAIGFVFYQTGSLISKSKRNWFIGIRTPWTLSSDYVWNKTHKITSVLFKIYGLIVVLSIFIFKLAFLILFVGIIGIIMFVYIYSYYTYKKLKK